MRALGKGDSFATIVAQAMCGDLIISEESYPPGAVLPSHRHEMSYVSLVIQGGLVEQTDRGIRPLGPHVVSLHPAALEHTMVVGPEGAWTCSVEFGDYSTALRIAGSAGVPDVSDPLAAGRMWNVYRELKQETRWRGERLGSLIDDIVRRRVLLRGGAQPLWMGEVLRSLHTRYRGGITVAEIAAGLRLHPFHVGHVFHRCIGRSISQYVRALRIADCTRALQASGRPISQIAYDYGFADQSHMTRHFKEVTGWTPATFRRQMRSPPADLVEAA